MRHAISTLLALVLFATIGFAQNGAPFPKATADIHTLDRCTITEQQFDDAVNLPASCVNRFTGAAAPTSPNGFVEIVSKTEKLSNSQSSTREISDCLVTIPILDPINPSGTCSFSSSIDLVLKTTSARTFNFIFPKVGQGVYTLKVKAAVASSAGIIGGGPAVGSAAFGLGSMTAEAVRLVLDFEF